MKFYAKMDIEIGDDDRDENEEGEDIFIFAPTSWDISQGHST